MLRIGVSTAVGWLRVIETGALSTSSISTRRASVNPLTACLEAEYIPCSGTTASETSLPTLISAPPCLRWGRAASEPLTTPQKLVSNNRRLSSSVTSSRRP